MNTTLFFCQCSGTNSLPRSYNPISEARALSVNTAYVFWAEVRLRTAPIISQSVEREAKKKNDRAKIGAVIFFFASRSTDCEKTGAAELVV